MQMLYYCCFEQRHRVSTRPAVVFAIQCIYDLVYLGEVHSSLYFPQQVTHRYQIFYTH